MQHRHYDDWAHDEMPVEIIDLATSRYQAKDLIVANGLTAVGITISPPKFPLDYECVYMTRLAPWGLREINDNDDFTRRYRERLDAIGIDQCAETLSLDLQRARWTRLGAALLRACRGVLPSSGAWPAGSRSRPAWRFPN
jgi:hypothetical protein